MTDFGHKLPLSRQAGLLRLSRSSLYHAAQPVPVPAATLAIMHRTDALHLGHPFAGSRMLRDRLRQEGTAIGRGFVHLAVVMDWFSRRVLARRLSITLEAEFCLGRRISRWE